MCGICGGISVTGALAPDMAGVVERMCSLLRHRGPDGSGVKAGSSGAIGHTRLAIVDLATGAQPIGSEDGAIWLVANAEIYNAPALRRELLAGGHVFRTRSDNEAILHLYEDLGPRCVERLRGMFAFCVWDMGRGEALLARDRAGQKPLFWCEKGGCVWFASEAKAILRIPGFERRIDPVALDDFLAYQYIPEPGSIFAGINKLPPAHRMLVRGGRVEVERYWSLAYGPKWEMGEAEAAERLLGLIEESVKLHLMSDVPVGAFLSGGVDSSVVVAMAARSGGERVKTFSIGFEEGDYDELPFARAVARMYGTEHSEFVVRPEAMDVLPDLVWAFDEPFADSSALAAWYVARMTSRSVKVALSGDGGDESFAGYRRYRGMSLARRYGRLAPAPARRGVVRMLAPREARLARYGFPRKLLWLSRISLRPPERAYAGAMTIFDEAERAGLLADRVREEIGGHDAEDRLVRAAALCDSDDEADRLMRADVECYLPGDLLVKADRMAMAHGLEARNPFLDHEVMEFAARLPAGMKLRGSTGKYILRKAAARLLPEGIADRPKMGFGVPVGRWFRGKLAAPVKEALGSSRMAREGYLRQEAIDRIVREHVEGACEHGAKLWALLCLELWYRTFIERGAADGPCRDI